MKLLPLLQEASSLALADLKKAMQKDKRVALIFKKDSTVDQVEDKEKFLSTIKFFLLNNENVRKFVASRDNIKEVSVRELGNWRKLRGSELDKDKFEWLKDFVKQLFKEHGSVVKGTISRDARKAVDEFVNSNTRGRRYLSPWVQKELESIPGIRPEKRVLLYRGILFSEYSLKDRERYDGTLEKGEGLKFLSTIRKGGRVVDLEWDNVSSWSTSKEVARRFAMFGPAESQHGAMMDWFQRGIQKRHIDGALGFVISTYAKPEDVLVDVNAYNTTMHHQHGNEGEMILKPGTYLARVVEKHTVDGEVDPDNPEADASESPAIKAIEKIKNFDFDLPEEANIGLNPISISDLFRRDVTDFKKLFTNSTTTKAMHAFDKLMTFYKKELSDLTDDEVRADKFVYDEKASKAVAKLKELMKFFNSDVTHSKFVSDENKRGRGKKFQLSSDEYRSTVKAHDLAGIEKHLLTTGRISDRVVTNSLRSLGRNLGVEVPSNLHQMGAAKQEPVIQSVIDAFYKKIGVDKPADKTESIKGAINLLKKAYRNARILGDLKELHEILGELK